METSDFYGTEKVSRILLKIAPPVMLAQLIQALYNIVDSFFVGKYSETGLTALSIIYPVQLLMIALGVGTGVGINTDMAYYLGIGKKIVELEKEQLEADLRFKSKELSGVVMTNIAHQEFLIIIFWFIAADTGLCALR